MRKSRIIFSKTPRGSVLKKIKGMNKGTSKSELISFATNVCDSKSVDAVVENLERSFSEEPLINNAIDYRYLNSLDVKIVNANKCVEALVELLEDEDDEGLGWYSSGIIFECFKSVGSGISLSAIQTLKDGSNESLGSLMRGTEGFLKRFAEVMINEHGEKNAVQDVIFRGEEVFKITVKGKKYYIGLY